MLPKKKDPYSCHLCVRDKEGKKKDTNHLKF